MQPRYFLGYPWTARRELLSHALGLIMPAILFVAGPLGATWAALTPLRSPVAGTGLKLLGSALAVVSAAVAAWGSWSLLRELSERFGLRVVAQFEREMEHEPGTYFSGHALARRARALDRLAQEHGLLALSALGLLPDQVRAGSSWFEPERGAATVSRLRELVRGDELLAQELLRLDEALQYASAQRVRFRLVLTSGTGMNGSLWKQRRAEGF